MISFVTFYIEVSKEVEDRFLPKTAHFSDPALFINTMFQSAEKFHPGCEKVLLTDVSSKILELLPDIKILRYSHLHPSLPILSRLMAQISYLDALQPPQKVIFLDADILLNDSLDSIFETAFDVALTYRTNRIQIFNGGILFIQEGIVRKGALFLRRIAENLLENHKGYLSWEGDQISFLTFIDPNCFFARESNLMKVKGFDLLFLDCDIYNYTPPLKEICEPFVNKKVLHFKDKRKKYFKEYWEKFLNPSLPPNLA